MISILSQSPLLFVIYLVALLMAIAVHEFSHAFVADKLGDPTPRLQGRVTLNPKAHIDLMGILFLFMFGFGWGRPVQFDPFNLKSPRRDAALISVAGPISNLLIAVILSLVLRATSMSFLIIFIQLNVMLAVFNLLPIHPLDGFKIVGGLLPEDKAREWYQLERYGLLFLILLILPIGKGSMISSIISPAISFVTNLLVR
ncbi:MAG: site-2 protease family protein [Microgenomates group bacterium]|nr:site-2 protease family protein [Candidatus Woesebacteria bacterium]MBP6883304.1 site-2 protease family protein [Candidatus Woesebacteria bacterium]